MTKEKKTFKGKIDGVSEVTETKKEGLFRFGVKANNDWYGFSGKLKECQDGYAAAREAKDKGYVVEFVYTDDGKWLNITKVGSWKVETEKKEIGVVNGGPLFGRTDEQSSGANPDREKAIAEAHEVDMVKKKVGWRLKRIAHMTECLEDAEKAWTEWFFGLVVAKEDLTPEDLTNIRAIANGFMAEDGRKSRG